MDRKTGDVQDTQNRILEYADLAPLAYLHIALNGNNVQSYVKHLLIDEMQDYSPIQYKVIQNFIRVEKQFLETLPNPSILMVLPLPI